MTLNRPERLNAINGEMSIAYDDAWRRFAADNDAWVAIITGAGDRAFCSGADLRETAETREKGQEVYRGRTPPGPLPPRKGEAISALACQSRSTLHADPLPSLSLEGRGNFMPYVCSSPLP